MSEDTDSDDKQFEPSQKKLDDARKRGEIARSADLHTAAAYFGVLLVAMAAGQSLIAQLGTVLSVLLGQADTLSELIFHGSGHTIHGGIQIAIGRALAPWFMVPAIMVLLSITTQRAFLFTPSKIAPKLSRISILSGFKNKFGRQGLFEFFKSFAKLILYSAVMSFFLESQMDKIIGSLYLPPALSVATLGQMLMKLMMIVLIIAVGLGGADYLWQRAEHIRKNRMSRKDMMDEHKNAEGDPMMKHQRRMRGQEIAMNKMLTDVPTADVIIVNPTHYAIALKWDRATHSAPVCVAKGVDEVATRIREIAFENDVAVHSDPPTARAIHASVRIGDEIAPEHYRAVAAAIRFAEEMRKKARP